MKLTNADKTKIKSLHTKKYRDKYNEYIAEGVKIVKEAIISETDIQFILIKGSVSTKDNVKEVMSLAAKESIPVEVLTDKEFDKLSALETPPGVLAVIDKQRSEYLDADSTYIILDSIKDPGNLGTIIRSADWFGINNIVIGEDSVDLYNPKVIQATMGSIFRVNITNNVDLHTFLSNLQAQNYTIIATSLEGDEKGLQFETKKIAILVGNETKGLDPKTLNYATHLYKIPGADSAESLNVSVATGIVLYQVFTGK